MTARQALSSKIAIFLLLVLLGFLANSKYRQWQSERAIQKQEQQLMQQANTLQKQNDDLTQSLQYLNSTSFKEEVARQQLGYKKNGEIVYGFTDTSSTEVSVQTQAPTTESDASSWWHYFFTD